MFQGHAFGLARGAGSVQNVGQVGGAGSALGNSLFFDLDKVLDTQYRRLVRREKVLQVSPRQQYPQSGVLDNVGQTRLQVSRVRGTWPHPPAAFQNPRHILGTLQADANQRLAPHPQSSQMFRHPRRTLGKLAIREALRAAHQRHGSRCAGGLLLEQLNKRFLPRVIPRGRFHSARSKSDSAGVRMDNSERGRSGVVTIRCSAISICPGMRWMVAGLNKSVAYSRRRDNPASLSIRQQRKSNPSSAGGEPLAKKICTRG